MAPRGLRLLSAAMPRDCERVRLGPLLVAAVPQRRGATYLVQAGCATRALCRASLSLKVLPRRGGAITIGSGSFRLAAGRGTTLAIALGPFARRLLARNRLGRLQVASSRATRTIPAPPRRTAWRVRLAAERRAGARVRAARPVTRARRSPAGQTMTLTVSQSSSTKSPASTLATSLPPLPHSTTSCLAVGGVDRVGAVAAVDACRSPRRR